MQKRRLIHNVIPMGKTLKTIVGLLVLLIVIWAIYQLSSTRPAQEEASLEPIRVGLIESLSDAGSVAINDAVQMALSTVLPNQDKVEFVRENVTCDAETFNQAFDRLTSDKGLVFLVDVSCPMLEGKSFLSAQTAGLPVLTLSPFDAEMASSGLLFSTVPSGASQQAFAARLARELGNERMAILSSALEENLMAAFPELGGHIVGSEIVEAGATDVRGDLATFEGTNPDVLVLSFDEADTFAAALAQIAETDLFVDVLASKSLLPADGLDLASVSREGLFLFLFDLTRGDQAFKTSFAAATGGEPGVYAAQVFDAIQTLGMMLKDLEARSADVSGASIAESLKELSFDGASGTIAFDAIGGVEGGYDTYAFTDGELTQMVVTQNESPDAVDETPVVSDTTE